MLDDVMTRILENVVQETLPKSVQLRVTSSQFNDQTAIQKGTPSLVLEETYLETDKGERYFDERIAAPNQPVSHKSSYCDGNRTAHIRFSTDDPERQQIASIGHDFKTESGFGFRDAPAPIRYYHVGLVPLHDALAGAERLGPEQVMGRNCETFHFKGVGPAGKEQSLVYSLDKETSLPLRIAAFSGPEQLNDHVPNWVWEAKSLDAASGRHVARSSTYSSFNVKKTATGHWESRPSIYRTIRVDDISFDRPIAHAAFWPTFQPGVRVMDSIAKRKIEVPGKLPSTPQAANAGVPIRVTSDQGSWLPAIGVVLSLAALAGAALLWRRRSR